VIPPKNATCQICPFKPLQIIGTIAVVIGMTPQATGPGAMKAAAIV